MRLGIVIHSIGFFIMLLAFIMALIALSFLQPEIFQQIVDSIHQIAEAFGSLFTS
jgi:hypothetical protein